MPERHRLSYGDFRPLRKGEAGYSPTRRLLVSPSTGEIISRREFIKKASREPLPKSPRAPSGRKTRRDKGMTRSDYKLLKPLLQEVEKRKKKSIPLDKDVSRRRFTKAKERHIDKLNRQRRARKQPELPYTYEPQEPEFYDNYDRIRHPDDYDTASVKESYDYFYYDEDTGDYEEEFPLGETP